MSIWAAVVLAPIVLGRVYEASRGRQHTGCAGAAGALCGSGVCTMPAGELWERPRRSGGHGELGVPVPAVTPSHPLRHHSAPAGGRAQLRC
jgi:hypothetical protein